jgi:DNA-binding transcriptional ArsR family regulator
MLTSDPQNKTQPLGYRCMKTEFARALPSGWERFSQFFFALGDRTRQQIVLVFEPNEEICVNDIVRMFHLSRPAISHHLKVLRNAGLLLCEKRAVHGYVVERAGNEAAQQPRLSSELSGPMSWDRAGATIAPTAIGTLKADE